MNRTSGDPLKEINMNMLRKAFTLMELLVVITIIGVLAALILPAIGAAITKSKVNRARSEVKRIESAIKNYYTDYGKLPVVDGDHGAIDKIYSLSSTPPQSHIMYTLIASNITPNANHALNPNRIVFLEVPAANLVSGAFRDPWSTAYEIILDNNYDNSVDYNSVTYSGSAVVLSYGPNRTRSGSATSGDDIVSFLLQK